MRNRLKTGLIQIYTGSGKGKTTAAIGLAMRASGAGLSVYMQQFIKNAAYSEIRAIAKVKNIKIEQCGRGCFVKGKPKPRDLECAQRGLKRSARAIRSGAYDLVILDEINVAIRVGLFSKEEVINMLSQKPASVEVVLTGRYCPPEIMKKADLVTEMKNVRHPFDKGAQARRGIEY